MSVPIVHDASFVCRVPCFTVLGRGWHDGTSCPRMKRSILYRLSSILIVLFAAGHTIGFRMTDPKLGVDGLLASMKSIRFTAQGFSRTYWDFFTGFGLFVSVFLLFAALLAWQLGGLPSRTLASLRIVAWALAICFVFVTILSWQYFFLAPILFSAIISVLLLTAAWLSSKASV
jgi:hypothetical protein